MELESDMTTPRLIRAAGLLLLASTSSTLAADSGLSGTAPETSPMIIESEVPKPVVGKGWYLRGDIGYGTGEIALEGDIDVPYYVFGEDGEGNPISWTERSSTKIGNVERGNFWSGGLGVGYDHGFVRGDITLDYTSKSKVTASRRGSDNLMVSGDYRCETDGACRAEERAEVGTLTTLLNVYADIGSFKGLSPYVGAGIGFSYVDWDTHKTIETCRSLADGCQPGYEDPASSADANGKTWRQNDSSNWRIAWALMAGVSYNLDENLALDVGYRYTGIEDGNLISNFLSAGGRPSGKLDYEDFANHEVRAGLRYTLPAE
jgi:opacity protein-like surface antigen